MEQADWYLGLVYVMNDEKDKAKIQFQKIENEEGFYEDEAAKILKKLRRK